MCHVRERMISINKFKDIVEVEKRVMIFSLKLVTLAKPVTSFNGLKNKKKKTRRYVNPGQNTYFDKLMINVVILNLLSIN